MKKNPIRLPSVALHYLTYIGSNTNFECELETKEKEQEKIINHIDQKLFESIGY